MNSESNNSSSGMAASPTSTTPSHPKYPTLQVNVPSGGGAAAVAAGASTTAPVITPTQQIPIRNFWKYQRSNLKIRTKLMDLFLFLPAFFVLIGLCSFQYTSRAHDVFYGNDAMISQFMTDEFPTLNSTRPLKNGEVDRYHVLNSFEKLNYIEDWKVWMDTKIIGFLWDGENPAVKNTRNVFNYASGMQALKIGAMQIRVIRTHQKDCEGLALNKMATRLGYQKCVESFSIFSPDDSIPDTFGPMKYQVCDPTAFIRTEGREQFYWCDGNVMDIPFSYSFDEAIAVSNQLHNDTFSILRDPLVRLIAVEMFMYFPATDTLSHYQLLTELPITGSVITSSHLHTIPMFQDKAYAFVMIIGFIGVATLALYREITSKYTILGLSMGKRIGFLMTWIPVPIYSAIFIARMGYATYFELKPDFAEFPKEQLSLASIMFVERHVLAVCLLALFGRLMNLMSILPMIRIVTRTIKAAFVDLVALICVFLVIFVTYALAGTILYSNSSPEWRNYPEAFGQTVLWVLGDADYEGMRMVNIPVTIFYFWSYTILVIFVLLNFFVGVLEYAFGNTTAAEGLSNDSQTGEIVRRELRRMVMLVRTIPRRDYLPLVECVKSIYDQQRESICGDLFAKEADKERAMDVVRSHKIQYYAPIGRFSTNAVTLGDVEEEYLRKKAVVDASPYRYWDKETQSVSDTKAALEATNAAKAGMVAVQELADSAKVVLATGSLEDIRATAEASQAAAEKANEEVQNAQQVLITSTDTDEANKTLNDAQKDAANAQQKAIIHRWHLDASEATLAAARATSEAKELSAEVEVEAPTNIFGRCRRSLRRFGGKIKHLYWKAFIEYPAFDWEFAKKQLDDAIVEYERQEEVREGSNAVSGSKLYDVCIEKWNKGKLFQPATAEEQRDFNLQVAQKTFERLLSVLDPTLQYCNALDEETATEAPGTTTTIGSPTSTGHSSPPRSTSISPSTSAMFVPSSTSSRIRHQQTGGSSLNSITRSQVFPPPRQEDAITAMIRSMRENPMAILGKNSGSQQSPTTTTNDGNASHEPTA